MSPDIPTTLSPLASPPRKDQPIIDFANYPLRLAHTGWKRVKNHKKCALLFLLLPALALGGCSVSQVIQDVGILAGAALASGKLFALFAPPASSLASFNATETTDNLSFQNMSLHSTSGNTTIKITDQSTGDLLGQQTFAYTVIGGSQIKFTNPGDVTSWIHSFSTYPGYVEVSVTTPVEFNTPPDNQTGTTSAALVYEGTPLASSTITIYGPHCTRIDGQRRCFPARPAG